MLEGTSLTSLDEGRLIPQIPLSQQALNPVSEAGALAAQQETGQRMVGRGNEFPVLFEFRQEDGLQTRHLFDGIRHDPAEQPGTGPKPKSQGYFAGWTTVSKNCFQLGTPFNLSPRFGPEPSS